MILIHVSIVHAPCSMYAYRWRKLHTTCIYMHLFPHIGLTAEAAVCALNFLDTPLFSSDLLELTRNKHKRLRPRDSGTDVTQAETEA